MDIVIFQNVRNSEIKDENKHHVLPIPLIIKDETSQSDILRQVLTDRRPGINDKLNKR